MLEPRCRAQETDGGRCDNRAATGSPYCEDHRKLSERWRAAHPTSRWFAILRGENPPEDYEEVLALVWVVQLTAQYPDCRALFLGPEPSWRELELHLAASERRQLDDLLEEGFNPEIDEILPTRTSDDARSILTSLVDAPSSVRDRVARGQAVSHESGLWTRAQEYDELNEARIVHRYSGDLKKRRAAVKQGMRILQSMLFPTRRGGKISWPSESHDVLTELIDLAGSVAADDCMRDASVRTRAISIKYGCLLPRGGEENMVTALENDGDSRKERERIALKLLARWRGVPWERARDRFGEDWS